MSVRIDSSQGGLTHLQLHDLRVDGTHLSDVTLQRRDDRYDLMIGDGVLDVQPLLQARQEGQGKRQESPADRTGSSKTEARRGDKPARRLHLRAPALRRVYFGPDRYLQDVRVELTHGETGWELIDIAGRIPDSLVQYTQAEKKTIDKEGKRPPPGTFTIDYKPSPPGAHELSVQTNDVGSMLRALNLRDSVIGGRMTMQGHTRDAEPNRPLRTTVEVTNVTVTDAPMLARVLAAASFTGLLNSLDQEGLRFSRVTADLTLEKGVISSKLARAYGGELGLTAKGRVDLATGNLDVNGTVIPARLLNTLPGKIPLIGQLIVGGKGQGLVAVNYRVQGKLAEPKVSVNPASALTPGFLRGIFGLFKSSGNDDAEPPPPSPSVQQNPR